ncbi:hypothetical protein TNCT_131, partial [Trichonephila clavata]
MIERGETVVIRSVLSRIGESAVDKQPKFIHCLQHLISVCPSDNKNSYAYVSSFFI